MSNEELAVEVRLAQSMPSWLPVAIYATLFGLGLSFELYIGNPTAIIYALVGIGMGLNYLTCLFYNQWVKAHNAVTIQQVTLEVVLKGLEDGTFEDLDGLSSKENKEDD